jgi:hypothetical protein
MVKKRLLQTGTYVITGQVFHSFDASALHLRYRHQTTAGDLTINQHTAGAAITGITANLGADEARPA